jgi:hypothetical protein
MAIFIYYKAILVYYLILTFLKTLLNKKLINLENHKIFFNKSKFTIYFLIPQLFSIHNYHRKNKFYYRKIKNSTNKLFHLLNKITYL